mmetsp:Transcript_19327/g.61265  ORF Transcript_19327/g.61265 Transcript_19327/m.61265 type:complete len:334 (-) Transcript_19327:405-1406(-)
MAVEGKTGRRAAMLQTLWGTPRVTWLRAGTEPLWGQLCPAPCVASALASVCSRFGSGGGGGCGRRTTNRGRAVMPTLPSPRLLERLACLIRRSEMRRRVRVWETMDPEPPVRSRLPLLPSAAGAQGRTRLPEVQVMAEERVRRASMERVSMECRPPRRLPPSLLSTPHRRKPVRQCRAAARLHEMQWQRAAQPAGPSSRWHALPRKQAGRCSTTPRRPTRARTAVPLPLRQLPAPGMMAVWLRPSEHPQVRLMQWQNQQVRMWPERRKPKACRLPAMGRWLAAQQQLLTPSCERRALCLIALHPCARTKARWAKRKGVSPPSCNGEPRLPVSR